MERIALRRVECLDDAMQCMPCAATKGGGGLITLQRVERPGALIVKYGADARHRLP